MNSQPQLPVSDNSSSVWPRRTSKACASCRRDKIRCDGARPCGGCTKKGYNADQCIDGCEPCRRARARCEDGKPCQRCRELHLTCIEDSAQTHLRQDPSIIRTARGNADRAKLACTNCRRDNKKCDDQRPCSRCIARSEECVHVGRGPKLVKLRCERCRHENKRCEEARPCKYCVESSKECISLSRKGRGHGTRVKSACVNCRRDKIRCDGIRPCSACVRKGCQCIERACQACSRAGFPDDCTHRRTEDGGNVSDGEGQPVEEIASNNVGASLYQNHREGQIPPAALEQSYQQQLGLSLPSLPMYNQMPSLQHYYYPPQAIIQGPSHVQQLSMMQTQICMTNHGPSEYYPVIDPNIDNRER